MQDLNLGSGSNVVSFTRVMNVASDSRHGRTPEMVSNGLEICIYTFSHIVKQLLLTKNCLKLTCAWVRKVLPCYVCDQAFSKTRKNEE